MNKEYLSENLPLFKIYTFNEIESTNTFAKSINDDFALIITSSQTKGRGRLEREFVSPPESGLYMSIVFTMENMYMNIPFITTAAAVCVHKAVSELTEDSYSIKWVNDIYKGDKKVSGILCEVIDDKRFVAGIGINLFPAPLPPVATSVFDKVTQLKKEALAIKITRSLYDIIQSLPKTDFIDYYRAHSMVLGKEIICMQGESTFFGKAIDIDLSGGLIVETPGGMKTLSSGEISIRLKD